MLGEPIKTQEAKVHLKKLCVISIAEATELNLGEL